MSKVPKIGSWQYFCNILRKKSRNCFCVLLWCKRFRYFTGFQSCLLLLVFVLEWLLQFSYLLASRLQLDFHINGLLFYKCYAYIFYPKPYPIVLLNKYCWKEDVWSGNGLEFDYDRSLEIYLIDYLTDIPYFLLVFWHIWKKSP